MSVYVKFDPWGRMGNRMFQYAFGYLLAKNKNTNLYTQELPNFNIVSNYDLLPNSYIATSKYGHNNVNFDELNNTLNDIVIDSFVQNASYYTPYKQTLKTIFNIKPQSIINNNKLVLHIRETDYINLNCFLGYDFYKHLINETGFTDVIIVTDNSNCETVQKLLAEGCTLNTQGCVDKFSHISDQRSMHDFFTLTYSENIAISQSSYSWWTAFLGDHKNIFFPYKNNTGMWKINPEKDDVDLFFNTGESKKIIL